MTEALNDHQQMLRMRQTENIIGSNYEEVVFYIKI